MRAIAALDARPRAGGLIVPYMVDASRDPIDFRALDPGHVDKCARQGRCGICGARIRGRRAFIGPRLQLEPGCYGDPWMHIECARVAMEQCPFLAGRRGWRTQDAVTDDHQELLQRYEHDMALVIAVGGHAHRDALGRWHFRAVW